MGRRQTARHLSRGQHLARFNKLVPQRIFQKFSVCLSSSTYSVLLIVKLLSIVFGQSDCIVVGSVG